MKLTVEDKSAAVGKLQRFKDFIIGKSVQDAMKKIGVCNDNQNWNRIVVMGWNERLVTAPQALVVSLDVVE